VGGTWFHLENHDKLMEVLGKVYADIFLSQQNRPKKTEYLDFVMSEVHGLRIKELVEGKKQGRKVVETYCTFVPEEIVIAAEAVMVGLCAGADFATEEVEKFLPKNLCALIKSTFGFKLGGVCPYLEASDLVIGENTSDGKKKAYEVFKGLVSDLYVIDLPQMKNDGARPLLRSEYNKFIAKIEKLTGNKITIATLKKAIDCASSATSGQKGKKFNINRCGDAEDERSAVSRAAEGNTERFQGIIYIGVYGGRSIGCPIFTKTANEESVVSY
jgi:hypothetical protein